MSYDGRRKSLPVATRRAVSPSVSATNTVLPFVVTPAASRSAWSTAKVRSAYPGLPRAPATGSRSEASRSTTRPPRRAQSCGTAAGPAASSCGPLVTGASMPPPGNGTGVPATVIRTRSMPGTCRRVQASWSTTRESSLGEAWSTSRDSGTSATPFSVTTTDRSRSVRDGSAERVTSAIALPGPASRPRTRLVADCSPRGMNTGSGSSVRPVWS